MTKLLLFSFLMVLVLSIPAVSSGITSVSQVILVVLVVAFFGLLVKGAMEGARTRTNS